jgi:hypothetical protein
MFMYFKDKKSASYLTEWPWIIMIAAMFVSAILLLCVSWGRWPDILVDFGRELYIPWQLSEGKVLYRDICFYYGPLSKYFFALIFKVFSPSLLLFVTVNFAVLGVLGIIIYKVLRTFASVVAAAVALGVFFSLFAFAQYVSIGNYNYICPYSIEIVHGLLLSLIGIFLCVRYAAVPSAGRSLLLGLVTGLVFLTKAEVFLALAGSLAAGALLFGCKEGWKGFRPAHVLFLVAGAFTPVFLFWVNFFTIVGVGEACRVILLPYTMIFTANPSSNILYQALSGLSDPANSLWLMGKAMLVYVAVALAGLLLAFAGSRVVGRMKWAVIAALIFSWALAWWFMVTRIIPPFEIFRPLPLVCFGLVVFFAFRRNFQAFLFAIFAMLLLLKILFYGHIFHYGFVLSAPAVLLMTVMVVDGCALLFDRFKLGKTFIKVLVAFVFIGVLYSYCQNSRFYYSHKNTSVGHGADQFLTYDPAASPQTQGLKAALDFLETTPAGSTVAVLPEGVMLNYLSRRVNPTPFFEFAPGFFNMVPEKDVLKAFQLKPPDYIVMVDRDMSEYGPRFFGRDYAKEIFGWVAQNYRTVRRIGDVPFSERRFWLWIGHYDPRQAPLGH